MGKQKRRVPGSRLEAVGRLEGADHKKVQKVRKETDCPGLRSCYALRPDHSRSRYYRFKRAFSCYAVGKFINKRNYNGCWFK